MILRPVSSDESRCDADAQVALKRRMPLESQNQSQTELREAEPPAILSAAIKS